LQAILQQQELGRVTRTAPGNAGLSGATRPIVGAGGVV
jgi:hypothetical protein